MTIDRFFDWFGFGALVCMGLLAIPRSMQLRSRGIRVMVVDRQRTAIQILEDLVAMVCMLVWCYELIACAWSLDWRFIPEGAAVSMFDVTALKIVGGLLMAAGVAVYGLGTRGLRDSWRLGIDRNKPGALETGGILAFSRNPIYLSFDLLVFGTFLIHGRLHILLTAFIFAIILHLIILREERFLLERHGEDFRDYCACVGRYITWPMTKRV